MASPFRADAGVQMANSASWSGPTGVGGIYYKTGVGLVMRKTDNSETTLGGGGGSTGNYSFSSNAMDLTGAATATLFTGTATGLTVGGSNLTSGFTISAAAASSISTTSGGLSINAAGTVNVGTTNGSVAVGRAAGVTAIVGGSTSSFDLSAGSGVFKTPTGTHTFGGATWNLPANTTATGASSATNTTGLTLAPNVADGASSIALKVNNGTSFASSTAKLLSLQNNGTELAYVATADAAATGQLVSLSSVNGSATNIKFSNLSFTTTIYQGNAGAQMGLGGNGISFLPSSLATTYFTVDSTGSYPTDNTNGTLGKSGNRWTGVMSYWYDVKLGSQLTAAATITPTSGLHHITGATSISTIATANLPASANTYITFVADGGTITFTTGGNIAVGATIAINTMRTFIWDNTAAKWYPHN